MTKLHKKSLICVIINLEGNDSFGIKLQIPISKFKISYFFAKNELFERLKMKISHWTRRRSKSGKNGQEPNLQHAFSMFRMCSRISNSHYRQLLVTKI